MNGHDIIHETVSLVIPTIYFTSTHDGNRDLSISRLPCSLEIARKWIAHREIDLGERVKRIEIKEVEIWENNDGEAD